jgi:hypothetical protein
MALYTVHLPNDARGAREAADEAVFVKDGFNPAALIFTGLWLLAKRLWLAVALFVAAGIVVALLMRYAGLPAIAGPLLNSVLALYLGVQGNDLVRARLARTQRHAGSVTGRTLEEAEVRFFAEFDPARPAPDPAALLTGRAPAVPGRTGDRPAVLGLFPQAGGRA